MADRVIREIIGLKMIDGKTGETVLDLSDSLVSFKQEYDSKWESISEEEAASRISTAAQEGKFAVGGVTSLRMINVRTGEVVIDFGDTPLKGPSKKES